jgi:hypothetical protein
MASRENGYAYLKSIMATDKSKGAGYVLDTLPWVSGGDITYIDKNN